MGRCGGIRCGGSGKSEDHDHGRWRKDGPHIARSLVLTALCIIIINGGYSWFVGQMMDDGDRDRHRQMDDGMDDGTRWKKWDDGTMTHG